MKKLFVTLICMAALVLTGCDNTNGSGPKKGGTDPSEFTEADIKKLDNKEDKCWCIRSIITSYGQKTKAEEYTWCTEREVAEYCIESIEITEDMFRQYGVAAQVEFRYFEAEADTKADCDKLNKGVTPGGGGTGGGEKACYYVVGFTRDQYGHLVIEMNAWMWVTEAELADLMAELENGWGVTETKAFPVNASDEYSCEHDEIDPEGWDEFWEKYSGYYD